MVSLFFLSCLVHLWEVNALPQASSSVASSAVFSSVLPSSASPAAPPASASAGAFVMNPPGGVGTSPTDPPPEYRVNDTFDGDSLQLVNMQEFIELDLFHHGLAMFSDEEFDAAGIDASQRYLIQVWAEQEVGHAIAINNLLEGKHAFNGSEV
jgi:hypothetical protein